MKEVIVYEASNGKRFDTAEECRKHEEICQFSDQLRNLDIVSPSDNAFEIAEALLKYFTITPKPKTK